MKLDMCACELKRKCVAIQTRYPVGLLLTCNLSWALGRWFITVFTGFLAFQSKRASSHHAGPLLGWNGEEKMALNQQLKKSNEQLRETINDQQKH